MQNFDKTPIRPTTPEFDLRTYARLLWQWAWLILLCTVAAGAAAYVLSGFSVPIYRASTTLLLDQATTTDYYAMMYSDQVAATYAQLMQRRETLSRVAQKLGLEEQVIQDGISAVQVTPVRDTQLLKVDIEGIWPEVVVAVAKTIPTVLIEDVKTIKNSRFTELETNLQNQIESLTDKNDLLQIKIEDIGESHTAQEEVELLHLRNELAQNQAGLETLRQSLENVRLTKVQSSDNITVVEQPQLPTTPVRPRVMNNTLLAAVVGAMLALGLIFLVEYLDDRIKTSQDLRNLAELPILGAIGRIPTPKSKQGTPDTTLVTLLHPRHPVTEAYRGLRTNLQFSSVDITLDSLLVTSAEPGEGKTTSAANLAVVMAQSGRRVILIDADLRKPKQHELFQLPQSPGLTEALVSGETAIQEYLRPTLIPNLQLLTSGHLPPNPAELLGSQRMTHLLQNLQALAEVVIVDTPPLLPVTDAQVLAGQLKGVLVVVKANKTRRAPFINSLEALERVQAHVLGTVLNGVTRSAYGYYSDKAVREYITGVEPQPSAKISTMPSGELQRNFQPSTLASATAQLTNEATLADQQAANGFSALRPEKVR